MKKATHLNLFFLICSLFFISKTGFSQALESQQANKKTVTYKMYFHGAKPVLAETTCKEIDQAFMAKKGIFSSTTNASTYETKVVMLSDVPEKDLKAIFISRKIEVEKINVTDNKN